jgi:hypothetical protein
MKLRTILLVGCMLVVPAWAMFSHTVPLEWRRAIRDLMSEPKASAAVPDVVEAARVAATTAPAAETGAGVPAATPTVTGGTAAAVVPVGPRQPGHATAPPQAPAIVSQLADRTRHVRDQQARELQAIESQLSLVGAVGFDCQPLAGGEGLHGCSCRVPIDSSGQLQRVFQAAGHDPLSAAIALRDQVAVWKERSAAAASGATSPAAAPAAGPPAASLAPGVSAAFLPAAGDRLR